MLIQLGPKTTLTHRTQDDIFNRVHGGNLVYNTIANFLRENPGNYTHYMLLDHQDWLAAHQPQASDRHFRGESEPNDLTISFS